jgi:hypothetical protein
MQLSYLARTSLLLAVLLVSSENAPVTRPGMSMSSASLIQVAKHIAEEILAGSVSPYDGGHRIWKECQLGLLPSDHLSILSCIGRVNTKIRRITSVVRFVIERSE